MVPAISGVGGCNKKILARQEVKGYESKMSYIATTPGSSIDRDATLLAVTAVANYHRASLVAQAAARQQLTSNDPLSLSTWTSCDIIEALQLSLSRHSVR